MKTDDFVTLDEAACRSYITEAMLINLTIRYGRIPFFWDGIKARVRIMDVKDFFEDLIKALDTEDFQDLIDDPRFLTPTVFQIEVMDEIELDKYIGSL